MLILISKFWAVDQQSGSYADSWHRHRRFKQPLERESDHRMLIDAGSPASSKAAASLL